MDKAVEGYEEAIVLRPNFPEALNNLGNLLQRKENLPDAVRRYREALALRPDYPEARFNLGRVLQELGRLDDAIAEYEKAIAARPGYAEAFSNLGVALAAKDRLDEAIIALRHALALRPGYTDALTNLGSALKDRGELDDAIACFRQAAAQSTDARAAGNVLLCSLYHPGIDVRQIHEEHVSWNRKYAQPLAPVRPQFDNGRDPDRRLRVGYVSPHLYGHVIGRYLLPLLSHHDRSRFEVFCYSDSRVVDHTAKALQSFPDQWRPTAALTDEQLAHQIRADKIDLLVDLAMHTDGNRLLVFARKPAPIQVTWLGYPGTTGLTTMDYRISDPYLDPPDGPDDKFYSEKTIRLPETYWCFPSMESTPEVQPLPATRNGYVTFGCLNNFCKINGQVIAAWAAVLGAVPDSRMLVLAPRGSASDRLLHEFDSHGIDRSRVEVVQRDRADRYLAMYNRIDVGLDTFPYNGHTTSLDSLWMGVPFVTLRGGATAVSRAGASILTNVGLDSLIADGLSNFVEVARNLVGSVSILAGIRSGLRDRMKLSPLVDGGRFAANLEGLYREIWMQWCCRRA